MGQADKLPVLNSGEQAQLERHVSILPRRWTMAALTRQFDAKDAEYYSWLRADPAYVRPEMGVVRLLACGELGLTQAEADELLKPLKVLFGDVGFPISAPDPSRWYLVRPSALIFFRSFRVTKLPSVGVPYSMKRKSPCTIIL